MQFNVPVRADSGPRRVGDLLAQGAPFQMSSADSIG